MNNNLATKKFDDVITQDCFAVALRFVEDVDYEFVSGGTAVNAY